MERVIDFFEILRKRRSIRRFSKREVSQDLIEKIVQYALLAPSPSDYRGVRFIAIRDGGVKERMKTVILERYSNLIDRSRDRAIQNRLKASLAYARFFSDAPVVIGVAYRFYSSAVDDAIMEADRLNPLEISRVRENPGLQGASASIQNLMLSATALGLGTCWMTAPLTAKKELEEILDISPPFSLMALVAVGFPLRRPEPNLLPDREELKKYLTFI